MVEATLSYLAPMMEKPAYYMYPPPEGEAWRNTVGDRRMVAIADGRAIAPQPSLEVDGVELVRHETAVDDLFDGDAVRSAYYPEMERLVAAVTGAAHVLAFDHNVRSGPMAEAGERDAQAPVRFVHNDYTEDSGPQRVRDLLESAEAEERLRHRVAVINVWKPMRGPVLELPLAVCDARTIELDDFVPTDLRYRDRIGEIYGMRWRAEHRWIYFPRMRADEAMLLKCYDSDTSGSRFTAHTAFDDPATPAGAPARESIEVRTLAFFEPTA